MRSSLPRLALMLFCLCSAVTSLHAQGTKPQAAPGSGDKAAAQKEVEFRAITVMDGTVYKGIVTASDVNNLTLKTFKGPVTIPILDIMEVTPIDREEYLLSEGRRVIFLEIDGSKGSQERARLLEKAITPLMARDDLLVARPSNLSLRTRQQMAACADLSCRIETLRDERTQVVYGVLSGRDKQERLVLRRLDRNLSQVYELAISVGDPKMEQTRLARSISLVLGETPPPEVAVAKADQPEKGPESTPATDKSPVKSTDGKTGTASQAQNQGNTTGAQASGAQAASGSKTGSDKASTEKAGGNKSSTEKAIADKSGTDKTAADKSGADKSAADKSKADKSGSEKANAGATSAQAGTGKADKTSGASAEKSGLQLDRERAIQEARRLDLLPVPGASSILFFKDHRGTAIAAASVAVLTTTAVYLAGDMRALGMPDGLTVGWTYPDRGPRDVLLLSGVGVASYVASTLIINQAVRVLQLNWHYR